MSVQERPDELIRLLRPEFAGRSGADSPASLTWGKIMLIPPAGAPVKTYPVTVTGLLAALTAATVAGSMIWVPPGTFNTAITIPANIALVALGEKVSINGQWTLNSGVVVANIVQTQSDSSAGALSGVVGPSSGIAYMKNCSITVENSGAGDAYAVNQSGAGELWLWACATYGNASGGGAGYGARQSAGTLHVSDDGRHRGSTGKFSGEIKLFSFDDVIKLKTSTFTQLYNATEAGVTAMLAAASSGDVVKFPRRKTIAMTSGITLTASVRYEDFLLSFSGFSGTGVTLANNATLIHCKSYFNGAGQAEANAIKGLGISQTNLIECVGEAENATTNRGIWVSGAAELAGVAMWLTRGRGFGGTTGIGMRLGNDTYAVWSGGTARDATTLNVGISFAGSLTGTRAPLALYTWNNSQDSGSYGGQVETGSTGRSVHSYYEGYTCGMKINSGAELESAFNYWSCLENDGTLTPIGEGSGFLEYASTDVSNPPTEPELITAFGSPADFFASQKIGHLNDNGLGLNEYSVFSDGSNYWFNTLAKAVSGTPSLGSVTESDIAAPASGEHYARANVQELSDGTWVLVYREGSDHAASVDGVIHIRFSNDYGETWTAEDTDLDGNAVAGFPSYPPGAAPGDAWEAGIAILILAPDNTLYMFVQKVDYTIPSSDGTFYVTSTDGGITWSGGGGTGSWTQFVYTGMPGGQKPSIGGTYFILIGVIYAVGGDGSGNLKLFKSSDNGVTWEQHGANMAVTADAVGEHAVEYVGNNTLIAVFRDNNNTVTKFTKSTDFGTSWAALTDITSVVGVPLGRPMIYTRSHLKELASWWNDNVVIMCGFELTTPGSSHERRNAVWVSQDSGDTWTGPLYVDTQQYDGGYGDLEYDPVNDKYVFISYTGPDLLSATLKQYKFAINNI